MANNPLLEKYVRSPFPVLKDSQIKYVYDELRKIEQSLGGLYAAVRSTGPYIEMPYGTLISTADQVAASTTAAYPITYSSVSGNGVGYQSSSQIIVDHPGLYNIQFSIQFMNTGNEPVDVDVWFRKNGTDIANSNSVFTVSQKKSSGTSGHLIGSLNFITDIGVSDYVELMWHTADVAASIENIAAKTGPVIPAAPSVIVTLDFISGI